VDEVEIHLVKPQPAEALVEGSQGLVEAVVGIGELRRDEKLVPRKVASRDRPADAFLIALDGGRVDRLVARLKGVPNDGGCLVVGNLPGTEAELRHGPSVVQSQRRLIRHSGVPVRLGHWLRRWSQSGPLI
jgi:hypothetical protein